MNNKFLRSVIAIISGWIVGFAVYMITMIVIAIFNQKTFQPGVQLSVGWLLIILTISTICGVLSGFVTAFIAQRSEIKHAFGLILVSVLISIYFMATNKNASTVPDWYKTTELILMVPSILFGGWFRVKQKILLEKRSKGMIRITSILRFLTAICLSFCVFVIILFSGTLLGGFALVKFFQKFYSEDYSILILPLFIVYAYLSFRVSRFIFRKITGYKHVSNERYEIE
jgi:hypothetical protein